MLQGNGPTDSGDTTGDALDTVARGTRIVEKRIAGSTVLLSAAATVGSIAGAVNADRSVDGPWQVVTFSLIALATAAALVAVRRGARVRHRTRASATGLVAMVAWFVAVCVVVLTFDPFDEWRWTALAVAVTVPNWVTAVRALRQAHGS